MAAATCRLKPMDIISGMVTEPVVATLPLALPESIPMKPLDTTATLAGPPVRWPAIAFEKSINRLVALEILRKDANSMKNTICVHPVDIRSPSIPSVPITSWVTSWDGSKPTWAKNRGIYGPTKQYKRKTKAIMDIAMPIDLLIASKVRKMNRKVNTTSYVCGSG